jgi:alpha-glucosidase
MWKPFIFLLPVLGSITVAQDARVSCPGYNISNIVQTSSTITADLTLAGNPCNVYSDDLIDLKLLVEYQTGMIQYQDSYFLMLSIANH